MAGIAGMAGMAGMAFDAGAMLKKGNLDEESSAKPYAPAHLPDFYAMGWKLIHAKDYQGAEEMFKKGLKYLPNDENLLQSMACACRDAFKFAEAQEWWERAAHVSSHPCLYLTEIFFMWKKQNAYQCMESCASLALQLVSENKADGHTWFGRLAELYRSTQKWDKEEWALDKLFQKRGGFYHISSDYCERWLRLLIRCGKVDKVLHAYFILNEWFPMSKTVQELREQELVAFLSWQLRQWMKKGNKVSAQRLIEVLCQKTDDWKPLSEHALKKLKELCPQ